MPNHIGGTPTRRSAINLPDRPTTGRRMRGRYYFAACTRGPVPCRVARRASFASASNCAIFVQIRCHLPSTSSAWRKLMFSVNSAAACSAFGSWRRQIGEEPHQRRVVLVHFDAAPTPTSPSVDSINGRRPLCAARPRKTSSANRSNPPNVCSIVAQHFAENPPCETRREFRRQHRLVQFSALVAILPTPPLKL